MNGPRTTLLFVYGTLKRGGANHRALKGQKFVGPARTGPGVTLYSLGEYPGLVNDPYDSAGVEGELWEVDEASLRRLDDLEGLAEGLYERIRIALLPPHDRVIAETYLYARDITGRKHLGSAWPAESAM